MIVTETAEVVVNNSYVAITVPCWTLDMLCRWNVVVSYAEAITLLLIPNSLSSSPHLASHLPAVTFHQPFSTLSASKALYSSVLRLLSSHPSMFILPPSPQSQSNYVVSDGGDDELKWLWSLHYLGKGGILGDNMAVGNDFEASIKIARIGEESSSQVSDGWGVDEPSLNFPTFSRADKDGLAVERNIIFRVGSAVDTMKKRR
ncbi:hypothetical protein PIB30_051692 [Stylosanthes scabra]|uniref:Uncharacterized protein n=1 Tax=Stylosanthes scabra TaxID=79078 RepID=A0ABU6WLD2_9FABA|nr:hypothetical protein [Stylosanthes scabra]